MIEKHWVEMTDHERMEHLHANAAKAKRERNDFTAFRAALKAKRSKENENIPRQNER